MRELSMRSRNWYPLHTRHQNRPDASQLVAYQHAVWRIVKVEDALLSETDREKWLDCGMPDLETWQQRPYRVTMDWVGGAKPPWTDDGDDHKRGTVDIPAAKYFQWDVYAGGRWPQCSCCGEPMPCRAELEDHQVTASLDRVARLESIPPGACWACGEPITTRQKTVTYPGENLDLPGGQQVHFHTRGQCRGSAHDYEERWVASDPRRERILTWPRCEGILVVHADGSSECVPGRAPLGGEYYEPQTDCRGHLTHDHSVHRACYVHEDYFQQGGYEAGRCPRGCDPAEHRGTTTTRRPDRREPSPGGLFQ